MTQPSNHQSATTSTLSAALTDGETAFALTIPGQGIPWLDTLATAADAHSVVANLLTASAQRLHPVADELASARPTDFTPLQWITDGQCPADPLLPSLSVPGILLTQIATIHSLQEQGLDLSVAQLAVGHSQGELNAQWLNNGYDTAEILAIAQLIGAAGGRQAVATGLSGTHTVTDQSGESTTYTPLLAVNGCSRQQLETLLQRLVPTGRTPKPECRLRNGYDGWVIVGAPSQLAELSTQLRTQGLTTEPIATAIGFHHSALAPAVDQVQQWAEACGIDGQRARTCAAAVLSDFVDWPAQIAAATDAIAQANSEGTGILLDLGPDKGVSMLTAALAQGRGVAVVSAGTDAGQDQLFTPGAPRPTAVNYTDFAPRIRTVNGRDVVDTAFTRLTGRSPIILAGMTPTTVDPQIVAAAANGGHWAELAGGGQVTPDIFHTHIAALTKQLAPGIAAEFNALYLDPKLWGRHIAGAKLVQKARAAGHPIDGVVISAGIPETAEAVSVITELATAGLQYVCLKPGTIAQINSVLAIADELAQQQPLAVVVDDMQWIDAASAALLHFVARRLADSRLPMLLAAAARAGEIDDNAGAQGLLASLAREGALQQHDLLPLQANHVRQWLGERLADVDEALRASGGNPLMLTELARVAGSASAAGSGSAAATSRPLDSLVHDRLRGFDDASRDLLGWAAALGGAFDADRLAAATALPMAELLSRLAQFERRGLLHATGDGSFDFCHGLVRQAIYRGLSTPRRKALHRQIARALDEATADDPWLHGSVVHHASLAGDARLATRAALSAGQHWLRVFANVEAAQVAERGLALLEELPPGAERSRLDIGLLRLRMAAASVPGGRRLPDLSQRITQATHAALALGLHADAAAAWELLAYWRQQSGDAAGAREASLAAERCTRRSDDITRCQQLANTGRCLVNIEADGDQGRQLLGEAEALATELQLPVMELEWGRGLLARADGDLATAREALSNAVAMAQAAANHWREYECMLALATTEYELGLADEVLRHAAEVAAAARRMGEAEVPFADALAALTRWRRGELEVAEIVRTSLAALRERDDKANLSYTLNEAAMLLLAAGDAAQASRYAEEALAAAAAVRRPTQIARARATLAAAAASPAQAS